MLLLTLSSDDDEEDEAPTNEEGERKPKIQENSELKTHSPEELAQYNKRALVADIGLLEGICGLSSLIRSTLTQISERLRTAKVDLNVLREYRKREKEFLERAKDLERVTNLRDASKKKYDDLRKTRLEQFMLGFNAISSKLKEMYQARFDSSFLTNELIET
jgi:structural maintenance of chromosome 4